MHLNHFNMTLRNSQYMCSTIERKYYIVEQGKRLLKVYDVMTKPCQYMDYKVGTYQNNKQLK